MRAEGRIDWGVIGREEFEAGVEALVVRAAERDPDRKAVPFDGRGGDGGRDIAIYRRDELEEIVQLKHFPEGFSSGWSASRKPQIKRWGYPLIQDTELFGSWEDLDGEDVSCGFFEAEGLHP
ncbi:MAG: hypothetical protein LBO20_06410 [Bifidobacteriaceae bacterium]|jgi:hypothetical protein|nr:hypothetical protein [Bifidobacteriaceae bacterium]